MADSLREARPRIAPEHNMAGVSGPLPVGVPAARMSPAGVARANARLELALALSGLGLVAFMITHEAFHLTVLVGESAYDSLSRFLERYYLLHAVVPLIAIWALAHIFLAARKVPTAFPEQMALFRHMRSLRHLDTWSWVIQVLSGIALLVLGSVHLWVVLTELPIDAAISGARVFDVYLWSYVPFVVLVQFHLAVGLYRIAVKWGLLSRGWAHGIATAWVIVAVGLGITILVALYRIGGSQ